MPEPDSLTPGYERIREPSNYEKLKYDADSKEDESDPNYEELKPQPPAESFHCYATINKLHKSKPDEGGGEPDYASLTRQHSDDPADPFYERLNQKREAAEGAAKCGNDSNNNCSEEEASQNELPGASYAAASAADISDLYSKVQKNVKR